MTEQPYREGEPIQGREPADQSKAAFEPSPDGQESHTLQDMSKDYAFFTPALITAAGRFDRDPVVEFNRFRPTSDESEKPFSIDSGKPFFSGLGVMLLGNEWINWDHRLYGIIHDRWEECRGVIGGILFSNPATGVKSRVMFHELDIVDHFALAKRPALVDLPIVRITVFAVSTNKHLVYMAPAKLPPRTLPYPVVEPPRDDVEIEAGRMPSSWSELRGDNDEDTD